MQAGIRAPAAAYLPPPPSLPRSAFPSSLASRCPSTHVPLPPQAPAWQRLQRAATARRSPCTHLLRRQMPQPRGTPGTCR